MNIKELKKDIGYTAMSLDEQVKRVLEFEGKIPQIDIDILMGSIRKLYEDTHLLNKLNKQNGLIGDEEQIEHPKDYSLKEETKREVPAKAKMQVPQKKKEEKPQARPEENPEPKTLKEESQIQEKPIDVPKQEKTQKAKKEESKLTIDLYADNHSTIADKFFDEQDKSVAARIKKNKISDLKAAIGINDKFLFINELFDGNMHEYNDAIEQLNNSGSLNEAFALIDKLKEKYNWEDKDSLKQIISYIEIRF